MRWPRAIPTSRRGRARHVPGGVPGRPSPVRPAPFAPRPPSSGLTPARRVHQARWPRGALRSDLRTFRTRLDEEALGAADRGAALARRPARAWCGTPTCCASWLERRPSTASRRRPTARPVAACCSTVVEAGRKPQPRRATLRRARQPPLPRPHPGVGRSSCRDRLPPLDGAPTGPPARPTPSWPADHGSTCTTGLPARLGKHTGRSRRAAHRVRILAKRVPATRPRPRSHGHPGRRAPRRGHRRPAGRARRPPGRRRGAATAAWTRSRRTPRRRRHLSPAVSRRATRGLGAQHAPPAPWAGTPGLKADRKKLTAWLTPRWRSPPSGGADDGPTPRRRQPARRCRRHRSGRLRRGRVAARRTGESTAATSRVLSPIHSSSADDDRTPPEGSGTNPATRADLMGHRLGPGRCWRCETGLQLPAGRGPGRGRPRSRSAGRRSSTTGRDAVPDEGGLRHNDEVDAGRVDDPGGRPGTARLTATTSEVAEPLPGHLGLILAGGRFADPSPPAFTSRPPNATGSGHLGLLYLRLRTSNRRSETGIVNATASPPAGREQPPSPARHGLPAEVTATGSSDTTSLPREMRRGAESGTTGAPRRRPPRAGYHRRGGAGPAAQRHASTRRAPLSRRLYEDQIASLQGRRAGRDHQLRRRRLGARAARTSGPVQVSVDWAGSRTASSSRSDLPKPGERRISPLYFPTVPSPPSRPVQARRRRQAPAASRPRSWPRSSSARSIRTSERPGHRGGQPGRQAASDQAITVAVRAGRLRHHRELHQVPGRRRRSWGATAPDAQERSDDCAVAGGRAGGRQGNSGVAQIIALQTPGAIGYGRPVRCQGRANPQLANVQNSRPASSSSHASRADSPAAAENIEVKPDLTFFHRLGRR